MLNINHLQDYVAKELSSHAIIGPFQCNPFNTSCVISPLLCVPKRDSSTPRVVHDLSFPDNCSVNSLIPKDVYLGEDFCLRLPGVDRLAEFIRYKGAGCHIFKLDLRRAYRQIPVDPADYHLLGFSVDEQFYFHLVMPFGLRSATMCCQRTTKAAVNILNSESILIDVYIDDFYGAETPDISPSSFSRVKELLQELGFSTSTEKESPPSTDMICLGIHFDTIAMTLSVPSFRIQELQEELTRWLSLNACTRRQLQSLLGKLSFVAACVPPGRVYFARLLSALRNIHSRSSAIPVSDPMRSDIRWWKIFLNNFNGVAVLPGQNIISSHDEFATDACLGGCGGILFDEFFHSEFPTFISAQCLNINQLEFLTILVAIKLWSSRLAGCNVTIHSDNSCCVALINYQRAHDAFLQRCLRELYLHLALHNISLSACHVAGSLNCLPDYLSRWHTSTLYQSSFATLTAGRELTELTVEEDLFHFIVD